MKRTPLQRYTPLTPVNRERRARTNARTFGAQAALCRTLPCCVCDAPPPSDPAHVRSRGAGGGDRGNVVPLDRCCHMQQHALGTARAESLWARGHWRWELDGSRRYVPARVVHLADVARQLERLAYPDTNDDERK